MAYRTLPKVELHLHLDCSLSYEVVRKLNPDISLQDYQANFIGPPKCHDLADFLTRAINGIQLMQTREQLHLVTLDLFEQLKADHVLYAEIRFAPLEHLRKGLTPDEVVSTVEAAMHQGVNQTGVQANLILCTLRHYTEEQSISVVKLVEKWQGTKVVGFDIASDEAGFPIDNHIQAFEYARQKGIHCTAHAGEAKGADSVWETLEHFALQELGMALGAQKTLNF
jgi:adenosine deaminase